MKKTFRMPPPIAILMGLCAFLMFAACDSSGESDADVSDSDNDVVEVEVTGTDITTDKLTNADFESCEEKTSGSDTWLEPTGWNSVEGSGDYWGSYDISTDSDNTYYQLNNYTAKAAVSFSLTQTASLEAGSYKATIQVAGGHSDTSTDTSIAFSAVSEDTSLATTDVSLNGWLEWTTYTISFTLNEASSVTLGISGTLSDQAYCQIDNLKLYLIEEE